MSAITSRRLPLATRATDGLMEVRAGLLALGEPVMFERIVADGARTCL